MPKRKKTRTRKDKNTLLNTISAVLVSTFLIVIVTGGIKMAGGLLGQEEERLPDKIEASQPFVGTTDASPSVSDTLYTLSVMADSENDLEGLEKAIDRSVQLDVDQILFLGDHTSWGDIPSLERSKALLENSGIPYVSIPGDHDLAASVRDGDTTGLENYTAVFGNNFHSLQFGDAKLVLLDNSANYSRISDDLVDWFYGQLVGADIVLLSQPLYHPTFTRTMGVVEGEEIVEVKEQAEELLSKIRESEVKVIIAADQHLFSTNTDPMDPELEHIVIGSLTSERSIQIPRFCLLKLLEDGSYEVEEVVL